LQIMQYCEPIAIYLYWVPMTCLQPGHLVRDCPTKHAVGDTGGKRPREGYVCRACGSEAHYIEDCPVANQRHTTQKRGPPKEIERMLYFLFEVRTTSYFVQISE
jgi:hypothetical protein